MNVKNLKTMFAVVFGFFLFTLKTPIVDASNIFCVYYKGAGPSNNCILKDKTKFNPADLTLDAIPDELQTDTGFPCNWYANGDVTYKDSKGVAQVQPVDPTLEVVYAVNLAGAYEWQTDSLQKPTAENACPKIDGYAARLTEKNLVYGAALFTMKNNVQIGGVFADKLQAALDEAKNQFLQAYQTLKDIQSKLCCYADNQNKNNLGTDCQPPKIKNEYNSALLLEKSMTPISSFKEISPKTFNPNDAQIAKYFSCDYLPTGASQYTLVLRNNNIYCLCAKDRSECDAKTYLQLADTTTAVGCSAALSNKQKVSTKPWECAVTTASEIPGTTNFCEKLVKKNEVVVVETPMGQGVDASVFNKLGTIDPKVLIARAIKGILGIIGSLSLVMFVYGGILLMLDRGNADQTEKAKEIVVWTSLGLAVIFAAYAIVEFIFEAFPK